MELTFTIEPTDISNAEIAPITPQTTPAEGETVEPVLTVTFNGARLTLDEDYTVGYTDNSHGSSEGTATITGTGNFTGTKSANFVIANNNVTVTFDSDGGSTVASQTIANGDKAAAPSNPTKEGFAFVEWQKVTDLENGTLAGSAFNFNTELTEDTTLKAIWKAAWTVTYESDGGTAVESTTVEDGETIDAAPTPAPTKTGYHLLDWYPVENATDEIEEVADAFDFGTDTITANTILKAKWEINTYTIAFDDGVTETTSGSTASQTGVEYGATVALNTNGFVYPGHSFRGWTDVEGGTTVLYRNGQDVKNLTEENSGTVKLYALWQVAGVDHIAIETQPTKTGYTEGDDFDPAGLVVTAFYEAEDNDNKVNVAYNEHTGDFAFSPDKSGNPLTLGANETGVTVTYGGADAKVDVTVTPAALEAAENAVVARPNAKTATLDVKAGIDEAATLVVEDNIGETDAVTAEITSEDDGEGNPTYTLTLESLGNDFAENDVYKVCVVYTPAEGEALKSDKLNVTITAYSMPTEATVTFTVTETNEYGESATEHPGLKLNGGTTVTYDNEKGYVAELGRGSYTVTVEGYTATGDTSFNITALQIGTNVSKAIAIQKLVAKNAEYDFTEAIPTEPAEGTLTIAGVGYEVTKNTVAEQIGEWITAFNAANTDWAAVYTAAADEVEARDAIPATAATTEAAHTGKIESATTKISFGDADITVNLSNTVDASGYAGVIKTAAEAQFSGWTATVKLTKANDEDEDANNTGCTITLTKAAGATDFGGTDGEWPGGVEGTNGTALIPAVEHKDAVAESLVITANTATALPAGADANAWEGAAGT